MHTKIGRWTALTVLAAAILAGVPVAYADQPAGQGPRLLWAGPAEGQQVVAPAEPATQPAERANPLPGITIDRQRRRVLLECRSLQPGVPLELIACMRNSRDHESLMVVRARPSHVHLAMLVCGYEPGRPAMWDEELGKAVPPSGDPVELLVQWIDPKTEKSRTVPIEDWLTAADPAKPVPRLHWLFTGSQKFENGQYLADMEGSVVSLANFADAVLDLPGIHSRDNEALEFKSNDRVMPPAGTACTLILLPPATLRLEMDGFGSIKMHGRTVLPARLGDTLAAHKRSRDDARMQLVISHDAIEADAAKLAAECEKAGFPADRIERTQPTSQPDNAGASAFPANDPQAAWDLVAQHLGRHRDALDRNLAAQQHWLTQLEQRRTLLGRQYDELSTYLDNAAGRYRNALRRTAADD